MHDDPKILVFIGLFCFGLGGYYMYRGLSAGQRVDVDCAELEQGRTVHAFWLNVKGTPRWDLAQVGPGDDSHRTFVPVVSDTWTPQRPVGVFLEVLAKDDPLNPEALRPAVSGVRVIGRGIGKDVRRRFGENGLREAEGAILMTANANPRDVLADAWMWIGIGAACLLVYKLLPRSWKTA